MTLKQIQDAIHTLAAKGLIYDTGGRREGRIVWSVTPEKRRRLSRNGSRRAMSEVECADPPTNTKQGRVRTALMQLHAEHRSAGHAADHAMFRE
jgi:hypothetical protein